MEFIFVFAKCTQFYLFVSAHSVSRTLLSQQCWRIRPHFEMFEFAFGYNAATQQMNFHVLFIFSSKCTTAFLLLLLGRWIKCNFVSSSKWVDCEYACISHEIIRYYVCKWQHDMHILFENNENCMALVLFRAKLKLKIKIIERVMGLETTHRAVSSCF